MKYALLYRRPGFVVINTDTEYSQQSAPYWIVISKEEAKWLSPVLVNPLYKGVAATPDLHLPLPIISNHSGDLLAKCIASYSTLDARKFYDAGRLSVLRNDPVADKRFFDTISELNKYVPCWINFDPETMTVL